MNHLQCQTLPQPGPLTKAIDRIAAMMETRVNIVNGTDDLIPCLEDQVSKLLTLECEIDKLTGALERQQQDTLTDLVNEGAALMETLGIN